MKKKEEHSKAQRKGRHRETRHPHKAHSKKSAWQQMIQRYTAL